MKILRELVIHPVDVIALSESSKADYLEIDGQAHMILTANVGGERMECVVLMLEDNTFLTVDSSFKIAVLREFELSCPDEAEEDK